MRDPIVILKNGSKRSAGLATRDIEAMEAWAADEVAKAVAFAEESPQPDPEELYQDVTSGMDRDDG